MQKKKVAMVLSIVLLILAVFTLSQLFPIISGYAAKKACSCVFLAERDKEKILKEDLNFSVVRLASIQIDRIQKTVKGSVWGMVSRTAVYREGIGCTLESGTNIEELTQQTYPSIPVAPPLPDTLYWPIGTKMADTISPEVNQEVLAQGIATAFDPNGSITDKKTRAVIVAHKGQLIGEKYAEDINRSTPILGWSMSKSVTNAMVGILVKQGKLQIEQDHLFPQWEKDERKNITIDDLMKMSSGLKWWEFYGFTSPATRMLYRQKDMGHYAIDRPLSHPPGSFWQYSSGTTNIIQYLLKDIIDDQEAYTLFPAKEIFNKIGMRSAVWEMDGVGTFVGSSYLWASARDWARFGQLYLNDGVWNGERILPEGWVEYSRTAAPASDGLYAAQFWLRDPDELVDVEEEMFVCQGFQGQRIFILPEKELVIVRMGLTDSDKFDFNAFLVNILKAFE